MMSKLIIEGGHPLQGEIRVAGNKNAALPILAATVLTDEVCVIENLPRIKDVETMLEILRHLGKTVDYVDTHTCEISGGVQQNIIAEAYASKLRASILYLSVLLAATGEIRLAPPGGCVIGRRNVQPHVDVVTALGATCTENADGYVACLDKPQPADIFLTESSVTATENAMLLAAAISGTTTITNAAAEPHVEDLAAVLTRMGATIDGAGTNRIRISGSTALSGFRHRVQADHIEAGTFAIAAAATHSDMVIHDACREHLFMTEHVLRKMGVTMEFVAENTLKVSASKLVSRIDKVQVGLWPAFPTDLMSPFIVLATQAEGMVLCHDWMYESRMFFVDKLIVMGARIVQCDPHRVIVTGPTELRGQKLSSPDIRAGIALVVAALTANGTSTIDNTELIDRGYEDIDGRLRDLGAKITRNET